MSVGSSQMDGGLQEIERDHIPLWPPTTHEAPSAPVANQFIILIKKTPKKTIFHLTKVRFPNVASQIWCDVVISAGIFCLSLPGDEWKFAERPPQWWTVWSNSSGADILLASDWSNFQSDWFRLMPRRPAVVHTLRLTQRVSLSFVCPAPARPAHSNAAITRLGETRRCPLKEWAKLFFSASKMSRSHHQRRSRCVGKGRSRQLPNQRGIRNEHELVSGYRWAQIWSLFQI